MIVTAKISSITAILERQLAIPPYQRPYRWTAAHVNQLFDDLLVHRNKPAYRLGTVVLHKHNVDDIVDGQQRLLTLTLLIHLLNPAPARQAPLLSHRFESTVSLGNLKKNAALLRGRVAQLSDADRGALLAFVEERCEIVCITLDDLGEAFQFFDSHNSRGKGLFPHDLLKAFHLRQMDGEPSEVKVNVVTRWENEVRHEVQVSAPHGLRSILGEILFPLRRWSMGEASGRFTRAHLRTFKGVDLKHCPYPSAAAMRVLDGLTGDYPFQVDQTMINGRRFFEYIQHYLGIYRKLFVDGHPMLAPLLKTINSYEGRTRTGDGYVRNLFCAAVLLYYDKFKEEGLEQAGQLCFIWSYQLRLTQLRVSRESVDNAGKAGDGLMRAIRNAVHPHEVLTYIVPPLASGDVVATKVGGLRNSFQSLRYSPCVRLLVV